MILESTKKEKEWLKYLQKELEENDGLPIYYGIRTTKRVLTPDGYGDYPLISDPYLADTFTIDEYLNYLLEGDIEDIPKQIFDYIEIKDNIVINTTCEQEIIRILEKEYEIDVFDCVDEKEIKEHAMFLTKKEAENYIKDKKLPNAYPYRMGASKSPNYKHLITLLNEIDWDKSNIELKIPNNWITENQILVYLKIMLEENSKDSYLNIRKQLLNDLLKESKYENYRVKNGVRYFHEDILIALYGKINNFDWFDHTVIFIKDEIYNKIIEHHKLKNPKNIEIEVEIPIKKDFSIKLKSDKKHWKATVIINGKITEDKILDNDLVEYQNKNFVFVYENNPVDPIIYMPKIF